MAGVCVAVHESSSILSHSACQAMKCGGCTDSSPIGPLSTCERHPMWVPSKKSKDVNRERTFARFVHESFRSPLSCCQAL